jgi:hypothetical protein
MDCSAAIEMNRVALKRILAMLVAMAGLGDAAFTSPLRGGRRSPDRRVGVIEAPQPPPDASRRPPLKGEVGLALPRHLYRAILRLLRPAEAAARRLIIAAARGLVVKLPPPRKPGPKAMEPLLRRFGIAVVMSPADLAKAAAAARPHILSLSKGSLSKGSLPLFDPLPRPLSQSKGRRRYVPAHAAPRICCPASPSRFPCRRRHRPTTRSTLRVLAGASPHWRPRSTTYRVTPGASPAGRPPVPPQARKGKSARTPQARKAKTTMSGGANPPRASSGASRRCGGDVRRAGVSRVTTRPRPIPAESARSTRFWPTPTRWPYTPWRLPTHRDGRLAKRNRCAFGRRPRSPR